MKIQDAKPVRKTTRINETVKVLRTGSGCVGCMAWETFYVEFLRDNLNIQNNVIDASHRYRVKKLLFLGSSCIYPKLAAQPIREESLLTSELEPTNQWYAIAKIAGIKMIQAYQQQFNEQIQAHGVDGLIQFLTQRNQQLANGKQS